MPVTANISQVKNLPNIEDTPVVEVFHNTPKTDSWLDDLPDDDTVALTDIDGAGLIIYLYQGNRAWFKTSVSKTPLSYLKKSLTTTDSTYFRNVILVRGTADYPLTEKEVKTLSGMLYERLKNTSVAGFTSYTTISEEKPETQTILSNTLEDLLSLIASYGFDVTEENQETQNSTTTEYATGTQIVDINGVQINITTKLKNEENPSEGLKYVSIKVTDSEGEPLLYTSSGVPGV